MMTLGIISALVLIVAINAKVTVAIRRSDALEPGQKKLQILLIWLLPVLGAALCWQVLNDEWQPSRRNGVSQNPYIGLSTPETSEDHSHSQGHGHDGGGYGGS